MSNNVNESKNNITVEGYDSIDINNYESNGISPNSISWILAKKTENNTYTTDFFKSIMSKYITGTSLT